MLLSTAYFPPISWFALVVQNGGARIEQYEHFEKQSYRNRCLIFGPNGVQTLSVPTERGGKKPIRDLKISYAEDWTVIHWRSLVTAYKNRPFFDSIAPDIDALLRSKPRFLWDLNLQIINMLMDWLQDSSKIELTQTFHPNAGKPDDFRYIVHPKKPSIFTNYPEYFQQFSARHGFQPDLSVIDLLFSEGRTAWDYLNELVL